VQAIRWNTLDDTFENGDWFHGRLYLEYCDISPDGKWMIYMAAFAHPSANNEWYRTAIAKVPSFKPFASNPRGLLSGGGGHFLDNSRAIMHGMINLPETEGQAPECFCWADVARSGGWYNRPLRPDYQDGRVSPDGKWTLRRDALRQIDRARMTLIRIEDGLEEHIKGANWADWDQSGRLVYARAGQLVRRDLIANGWEDRVIADFDDGRHPNVEVV
jgi:hypothetical protein